jgi:hypothetical protein
VPEKLYAVLKLDNLRILLIVDTVVHRILKKVVILLVIVQFVLLLRLLDSLLVCIHI